MKEAHRNLTAQCSSSAVSGKLEWERIGPPFALWPRFPASLRVTVRVVRVRIILALCRVRSRLPSKCSHKASRRRRLKGGTRGHHDSLHATHETDCWLDCDLYLWTLTVIFPHAFFARLSCFTIRSTECSGTGKTDGLRKRRLSAPKLIPKKSVWPSQRMRHWRGSRRVCRCGRGAAGRMDGAWVGGEGSRRFVCDGWSGLPLKRE